MNAIATCCFGEFVHSEHCAAMGTGSAAPARSTALSFVATIGVAAKRRQGSSSGLEFACTAGRPHRGGEPEARRVLP
jgi:hypothetical protein